MPNQQDQHERHDPKPLPYPWQRSALFTIAVLGWTAFVGMYIAGELDAGDRLTLWFDGFLSFGALVAGLAFWVAALIERDRIERLAQPPRVVIAPGPVGPTGDRAGLIEAIRIPTQRPYLNAPIDDPTVRIDTQPQRRAMPPGMSATSFDMGRRIGRREATGH